MKSFKTLDPLDRSESRYRELADWLEVLRGSLDSDRSLSAETQTELHESLGHAEAALRRAIAEKTLHGKLN